MTLIRALPSEPITAGTVEGAELGAVTKRLRCPELPTAGSGSDQSLAASTATPTAPVAAVEQPWDLVEEWGRQSFPASDPPANW
jgi:hypothetical protein